MIYLLLAAWTWFNQLLSLNQISQNNQARQEAQAAYQGGQYRRAQSLYAYLSTKTTDPAVRLNLGHAYFKLGQYARAKPQYDLLLRSDRSDLRTAAATQLGVIACLEGDSASALTLFQQALLENTDNQSARYNFELIKTFYSGKPPAKPNPRKQEKPRLEKLRPLGSQQVERSTRHDDLLRRFQGLNLSEAQALQLLEAMRNDDLPYALTQSAHRSKSKATRIENRW